MVRINRALNSISIVLCFSAFALLQTACTPKSHTSTVSITIPNFAKTSSSSKVISQTIKAQGDGGGGSWGLPPPALLSDFSCFGVMVGGGEPEMRIGTALDPAGGFLFNFGKMRGLVAPGGTLNLAVPSGPARTIFIIGFQIESGRTCESINDQSHELTDFWYSPPFWLGQKTVDLAPGDAPPITIKVSYTAGTTKQIGDVKFPGPDGKSQRLDFGTGADGDITISGTQDLESTLSQDSSHYLGATAPIQSIVRPDPTNFPNKYKLGIPGGISTAHFPLNSEIMLYVAAEKSSIANQSGCGNKADDGWWSGFLIPARVLTTPYNIASNYFVDLYISDQRATQVTTTRLIAATNSTDFCRLMMVRVPHINKLTLSPGATLSNTGFTGLGASSAGGILIMRVKDKIEMPISGSAGISMNSRGYLGGVSIGWPGEGDRGMSGSASTMSNGSGGSGGTSFVGAGGGAGGGKGGDGYDSTNLMWTGMFSQEMGDSWGCDTPGTPHCLFHKIYMGGGGGAKSSPAPTSNAGGGIVAIFANSLVVGAGQTISIESIGGLGSGYNGGGGGGNVFVRTNTMQVAGNLNFNAYGGDADPTGGTSVSETYVGAGGGGRIHVDVNGSCAVSGALVFNKLGGRSGPNHATPRIASPGTFFKSGAGAGTCVFGGS